MAAGNGFLLRLGAQGVVSRHSLAAGPITIGREPGNSVHIADKSVSRHHARVETVPGGGVSLVDLGSTHYSYVDGEHVERATLEHGARISIALLFDFVYLDHEDPALVEDALHRLRAACAPELPPAGPPGFMARELQSLIEEMNTTSADGAALRRMQERVDRSIADLQCLYEIGTAINSELDLERVLQLILTQVIGASGAERGFVLLLDAASQLVPTLARDLKGPLDPREMAQYSTSIATRAMESRQTVWTSDTRNDPVISSRSIVDFKIRSAICAPLLAKGQVRGVLYVDAKQSLKQFGPRDAEFFMALASQSAIAIENAQLVDSIRATIARLDRKVLEVSALHSISEQLIHSTNEDAMLATILDKSVQILSAERGSVLLHGQEHGRLVVRMMRGSRAPGLCENLELPHRDGTARRVVETGQGLIGPLLADDPQYPLFCEPSDPAREILCVPLKRNEEALGVISLVKPAGARGFAPDDLQLMASIASQAAVTIENSRLYHMAVFDGLTALHVRRYFDGWLQKEYERARRYGSELCLILIDIDHFKRVNDTHGHPVGDVVLKDVAAILQSMIRGSDLAARWGGEEFVIGLPQTSLAGAAQFAERLRQRVEDRVVRIPDRELKVTISLGVCSLEASAPPDRPSLVRFADRALYAAKAAGRNGYVLHHPDMEK